MTLIELFRQVVGTIHEGLILGAGDYSGECPPINFMFGSDQYIKDRLDEYSKSHIPTSEKFPMVALLTPFKEDRRKSDYFTKASVSVVIATASRRDWTNEEREQYSFAEILRPIYEALINGLKGNKALKLSYDGTLPHDYQENFDFGRYGAYTQSGDEVSEPIDAINLMNLEITLKTPICKR